MKGKLRVAREEEFLPTAYTYDSIETGLFNCPLKSPSPDKKSANIIVSTRSPDIHDLKRSATPTREELGALRAQRSEVREKNFQLIENYCFTQDYEQFYPPKPPATVGGTAH